MRFDWKKIRKILQGIGIKDKKRKEEEEREGKKKSSRDKK